MDCAGEGEGKEGGEQPAEKRGEAAEEPETGPRKEEQHAKVGVATGEAAVQAGEACRRSEAKASSRGAADARIIRCESELELQRSSAQPRRQLRRRAAIRSVMDRNPWALRTPGPGETR